MLYLRLDLHTFSADFLRGLIMISDVFQNVVFIMFIMETQK